MAAKDELPSTLQRSPEKAQRTWSEAHDSTVQSYGEGERAHRTAYAALKHTHRKVGDHWEAKDEAGPSDSRAERGAADSGGESVGGVDANASKDELYRQARQLDVRGRSSMSKNELVEALRKASERETARARAK